MAISITAAAAEHVSGQIDGRGCGLGIRVGVKTSGCSGLAYVLEFVDHVSPEDVVFEDYGVKIFVDPKSLVYLDGTELDFVKEGFAKNLKHLNANAIHDQRLHRRGIKSTPSRTEGLDRRPTANHSFSEHR